MGSSCIITDNAAQFSRPNFPGYKHLLFFEEAIELENGIFSDIRNVRVLDFPKRVSRDFPVRLISPSSESISNVILALYQTYDDIFIILISRELHPNYNLTEEIVKNLHGRADIHLIDSRSLAIGEGQLIQMAAEQIIKEQKGTIIEEKLREAIPHTYTLIVHTEFILSSQIRIH